MSEAIVVRDGYRSAHTLARADVDCAFSAANQAKPFIARAASVAISRMGHLVVIAGHGDVYLTPETARAIGQFLISAANALDPAATS